MPIYPRYPVTTWGWGAKIPGGQKITIELWTFELKKNPPKVVHTPAVLEISAPCKKCTPSMERSARASFERFLDEQGYKRLTGQSKTSVVFKWSNYFKMLQTKYDEEAKR